MLCEHEIGLAPVAARTPGCEECLKTGMQWVATKHFHRTNHPVIASYEPRERWGWCSVDEADVDLPEGLEYHLR
jgi:hypothetical protein